jgi:hypothetical protein
MALDVVLYIFRMFIFYLVLCLLGIEFGEPGVLSVALERGGWSGRTKGLLQLTARGNKDSSVY